PSYPFENPTSHLMLKFQRLMLKTLSSSGTILRLREFKGKIDWSGAVFKLELLSKSSYRVNVLYSAYVNA
ncbi:hypothetical protein HID58_045242, partial [Brassica napus]